MMGIVALLYLAVKAVQQNAFSAACFAIVGPQSPHWVTDLSNMQKCMANNTKRHVAYLKIKSN